MPELNASPLCINSPIEVDEDALLELVSNFPLSWLRRLAPSELVEIEANSDMALLTTELSPVSTPSLIACIRSALSAALALFAEAALEPASAAGSAYRMVT